MWPFIAYSAFKAAGAALDFFGKRREGRGELQVGEMERNLYGKNADLAEQQAKDAEARGQELSNRQVYKMRTLLGAQNTAFAGQGVTMAGTAGQLVKSDAALGEADRLTILENARREAWGFRQQADIYRGRGNLAYLEGRNKQKEANWESIGSLVNFGGDMVDLFHTGKMS